MQPLVCFLYVVTFRRTTQQQRCVPGTGYNFMLKLALVVSRTEPGTWHFSAMFSRTAVAIMLRFSTNPRPCGCCVVRLYITTRYYTVCLVTVVDVGFVQPQ